MSEFDKIIFIFIGHSFPLENCSDFQKNGFSIFSKSIAFFENIVQYKKNLMWDEKLFEKNLVERVPNIKNSVKNSCHLTRKGNIFHVPLHFTYLLIWRNLNANLLAPHIRSVQCTRLCDGTRTRSRLAKCWKNSRVGIKNQ